MLSSFVLLLFTADAFLAEFNKISGNFYDFFERIFDVLICILYISRLLNSAFISEWIQSIKTLL